MSVIEKQLLELWRNRSDGAAVAKCCEVLIAAAPTELKQVELYLPQFAHMIITLVDDVANVASIERFVLSASQISMHVALQFFWMVYAALQENRPKRGGNRGVYVRCARLLLQLEQCVVYGVPSSPVEKLTNTGSMQALMTECAAVADAVVASTLASGDRSQSAKSERSEIRMKGIAIAGTLNKKGGGLSRFGRRNWHDRYCEVRDRVFYYYSESNGVKSDAARSPDQPIGKPKGSMALNTAVVTAPNDSGYGAHYFVLTCKQTGLTFHLRAATHDEYKKWVTKLTALSALPAPPGVEEGQLSDALEGVSQTMASDETPRDGVEPEKMANDLDERYMLLSPTMKQRGGPNAMQRARRVYEYFNSQREFIRSMTNVAEALRSLPPDARQEALQPHLEQLQLPPRSYFPLVHSDETCCSLMRFTPNESLVFNTKARCPLLLICETRRETFTVGQIARQLSQDSSDGIGYEQSVSATMGPLALSSMTLEVPPESAMQNALTMVEKKKEPWARKQGRLAEMSPLASMPNWELRSFIVKSNDDLRQEVFIMQMISYFRSIWPESVWLNSYHILATGPDTGLIETIIASADLDNLKKRDGYVSLRNLFIQRHGEPGTPSFVEAQNNFASSLAAYSVVMWLLLLRDRHNGNLMLDESGHYFHIDFGFCLGHSTGKQIGGMVECSAFKLTEEYIDVLDGRGSAAYKTYCQACIDAMLRAHDNAETICTMVEIVGTHSNFPCFVQTNVKHVIPKLRKRLFMTLPRDAVAAEFQKVIDKAAGHWGSRNYDWFQNLQRGIAI